MRELYRQLILPASILSGTIIGAGVFSLPYVFVRSGILVSASYLLILTVLVAAIHLMFAEVVIRTPQEHRFVWYVRNYLGKPMFSLSLITSVLGLLLTLTIYLILSVSFINLIFPSGADIYKIISFWIAGSLLVLVRVKSLALFEFLVTLGILFIIGLFFLSGLSHSDKILALPLVNVNYLLLPFGPILFSLIGRTAIPSVIRYFQESNLPKELSGRAIMWGTAIPAIFYFLFVAGVIGLSGEVSADSVSGLIGAQPIILQIAGILGILSLLSTYIVLGIDIVKNLHLDLKFPEWVSIFLVILFPLVSYAIGFRSFFDLVKIVGGVFIGIEGAMIALMWGKLHFRESVKKSFAYVLASAFLLGAIYEIMSTAIF